MIKIYRYENIDIKAFNISLALLLHPCYNKKTTRGQALAVVRQASFLAW